MTGWVWLDEHDATAIHNRALILHGGAGGMRDAGLLQSALARPRQIATYADYTDAIVLAAAYTVGIVKNHPFIDGNKRTGFILGVLFLELNGKRFIASEEDAAAAVIALAAGEWDDDAYITFLRANVTDG
jgi:death-on-curing protein